MKEDKTFLDLYKEYETLVRDKGMDCKEIEDSVDELTGNRLRMCRQIRNYLSHQNDANFLVISKAQLDFLQEKINELNLEKGVLKQFTKSINMGTCSEKDKCSDVAIKICKNKNDNIVVITEKGYAVATLYDICLSGLESKTKKMKDVKMKKISTFASPTTPMADLKNLDIVICTSDGTANGKLLGVFYRNK